MRLAVIEWNRRDYVQRVIEENAAYGVEIVCYAAWDRGEEEENPSSAGGGTEVPLSQLRSVEFDAILIALKKGVRLSRTLLQLHDMGLENIYILRRSALEQWSNFMEQGRFKSDLVVDHSQDRRPWLGNVDIHVCDRCNLNCKGCLHFSPFAKEDNVINIALFEQSLRDLRRLFAWISNFLILGGEPLLHPNIVCQIMILAHRYFPDTKLELVTNGLLIERMTADFWAVVREQNAAVDISLYPPTESRLPVIERILREQQVLNNINQVKGNSEKTVTHFCKFIGLESREDAAYNAENCMSRGCFYLREGKLTKCAQAIHIGDMAESVGLTREDLASKQVYDLSEVTDAWELLRILHGPIDQCRRCAVKRMEIVPWGVAGTHPDPSDWLV